MDFRIDAPYWLLLLLPIAGFLFFTWKTSDLKRNRKGKLLMILRCLAIVCLILALAVPSVTLRVGEEQVLFVVDRSVSIEDAGDEASHWIAESLESRQAHQSVGIYSFGQNIRTDVKLTNGDVTVPEIGPLVENTSTDIANAIEVAATVAEKNIATRIVLLSDGLETSGTVDELLSKYEQGRVSIDTVLLERPIDNDASITLFETPRTAYEGEQQLLKVEVEASKETKGELLIYENDAEIIREPIELVAGKNSFSYRKATSGNGLIKYEAKIVVPDDRFLENNRMVSITMMEHSPRVLVVETDRNPSVIPSLLDQEALDVVTMNAKALPESLASYMDFDAIVFDNVPGHLVGEDKMKVIEQSVKNFGTGFLMVGGDESFGLGGYFKTPIERILPVEMEVKGKEKLPSLGLVIVMDRSGSMFGPKIILAREAAARSVELLREDDHFGFIAFDDQVWEVIPLGPLKNPKKAIEQILSVPAAGGTEIYPGMKKAYEDLEKLDLQRKHIILMTDGQSPMPSDYEDVILKGKDNLITMSTVAIGSDADGSLLESLAASGGGRFYDVVDETTIPSILSRETSMMTRTYIEDDPFFMSLSGIPEWNTLFTEGVPEINAYIATTIKATAQVVGESPKEDPVIAEWMYGLGRTVAFTSDSTGKWSGDLARWQGYADFWNTAVARILPSYENVPYLITHERGGTYTVTDSTRNAAFLEISIIDENGNEVPYTSEFLAPGKVRVTLDANPGLVFFGVSDDQGGFFEAGISVPYPDEYKPLPPNRALMQKIADRTNGKVLTDPAEAFRNHPYKSGEKRQITNMLVLLSMILFFIDITLRRFGMFKGFGIKPAPQPVTETPSVAEENIAELLKAKRKR